jgi:uncharacterized surface protein with fasciclin (FAS1) repeats
MECSATKSNNMVVVAMADGCFPTLVTVVKIAKLAETLKSEGPFSVAVPIAAVFAKVAAAR